jgi:hypothetical protein
VGLVVRRVLEVSAGTLLAANAESAEGRLAMVNSRVITLRGAFAEQSCELQEVA